MHIVVANVADLQLDQYRTPSSSHIVRLGHRQYIRVPVRASQIARPVNQFVVPDKPLTLVQ
jgi:hypothetical protein